MSKTTIQIILCILIGYCLGCVSPSYLIGKQRGYDIRVSGTGNAGASNTVILAGNLAGAVVAAVDILKAATAWWICRDLFPEISLAGVLGGVAAELGHMFPVYLHFHGGKGLACMGGLVLAYNPRFMLCLLGTAILIGLVTKYVCLVTISMSVIWPACYYYQTGSLLGACILALPILPIFIRHIPNLKRIGAGQELRLSYLWKKEEELARIGRK